MIAALLPLLEALGAEGGASAALGGGVTGAGASAGGSAGIGGTLGRLFAGPRAFGSSEELGGALRQISDLSAQIKASQEAIAANRSKQEEVSSLARDQERQYAFSDPSHREKLSELAREQQERVNQIRDAERQRSDLNNRATMTTDAAAYRAASFRQAGAIVGAGAAVASVAPTMAGQFLQSNPVSTAGRAAYGAAQGVGAVSNTQSNIIQGAGNFIGGFASIPQKAATNPFTSITGEFILQLSKAPGLIKSWGESLVESQRTISRFSPVMAQAFAQQERRETVRGIGSAQRTGGATSDLSSSLQDLADQIQPLRDTIQVVMARGLNVGVQYLVRLVKVAEGIFEIAKRWDPTGTAKLLEMMEEESRLKSALAMQPLVSELRKLNRPDSGKPKDVPRR